MTYREPILDAVRDVDNEFARLLEGLRQMDRYRDATIVLYSDHGHINHLLQEDFGGSTDMVEILYREGLLTEEEKKGIGFSALGVSSVGGIWRKGDTLAERQAWALGAREALLRHEIVNPQTGERECPWFVGTHEDMMQGMPGYAEPGELWHAYYGPRNDPDTMLWPDLVLGAKNGWQIPIYGGVLANIGILLPEWFPPFTLFLGGHGAIDTLPIVMAVRGSNVAKGKVVSDPTYAKNHRVSDLAVTIAQMYDLNLRTTIVGQDLTADLA
jgi:arylsulfatase A-like enzyme